MNEKTELDVICHVSHEVLAHMIIFFRIEVFKR